MTDKSTLEYRLAWALVSVLDGTWTWYDLQNDTGLSKEECELILNIRDEVRSAITDTNFEPPKL